MAIITLRLESGRGSVGRMSPCQGEGRGFESHRPLLKPTEMGVFDCKGVGPVRSTFEEGGEGNEVRDPLFLQVTISSDWSILRGMCLLSYDTY